MCARMPIVSVLVTCRSVPGPGARGRSLVQRTNEQSSHCISLVMLCWVVWQNGLDQYFKLQKLQNSYELVPVNRRVMVRLEHSSWT